MNNFKYYELESLVESKGFPNMIWLTAKQRDAQYSGGH